MMSSLDSPSNCPGCLVVSPPADLGAVSAALACSKCNQEVVVEEVKVMFATHRGPPGDLKWLRARHEQVWIGGWIIDASSSGALEMTGKSHSDGK